MLGEDGITLLAGLAMVVGLLGIVLPVLPGLGLICGAALGWALVVGSPAGWVAFGAAVLLTAAATVAKYYLPGKRLQAAGVPNWVLLVAAIAGIVGFFVVPVVGLPLFFVLGVYAAESLRHRHATRSLRSTWQAVLAAGLSLLIELGAGLLAVTGWGVAVVVERV